MHDVQLDVKAQQCTGIVYRSSTSFVGNWMSRQQAINTELMPLEFWFFRNYFDEYKRKTVCESFYILLLYDITNQSFESTF